MKKLLTLAIALLPLLLFGQAVSRTELRNTNNILRAQIFQSNTFSVTVHGGLVGSGTTDNSTNLQALVNAHNRASRFLIPAGTYLITNTVWLTNVQDCEFVGTSAGSVYTYVPGLSSLFVWGGPTNGTMFQVNRSGGLAFRNLGLDTPHANAASNLMVIDQTLGFDTTTTDIRFENVMFRSRNSATNHNHNNVYISPVSTDNCENILFDHCSFYASGMTQVGAFSNNAVCIRGGNNQNAKNIRVSYSTVAGYGTNFLFTLNGGYTVEHCTITAVASAFVVLNAADTFVFDHNRLEQFQAVGRFEGQNFVFRDNGFWDSGYWEPNRGLVEIWASTPMMTFTENTFGPSGNVTNFNIASSASPKLFGRGNYFTTNNPFKSGLTNFNRGQLGAGLTLVQNEVGPPNQIPNLYNQNGVPYATSTEVGIPTINGKGTNTAFWGATSFGDTNAGISYDALPISGLNGVRFYGNWLTDADHGIGIGSSLLIGLVSADARFGENAGLGTSSIYAGATRRIQATGTGASVTGTLLVTDGVYANEIGSHSGFYAFQTGNGRSGWLAPTDGEFRLVRYDGGARMMLQFTGGTGTQVGISNSIFGLEFRSASGEHLTNTFAQTVNASGGVSNSSTTEPISSAAGFVSTGTGNGFINLSGSTSGTQIHTVPAVAPPFTNTWSAFSAIHGNTITWDTNCLCWTNNILVTVNGVNSFATTTNILTSSTGLTNTTTRNFRIMGITGVSLAMTVNSTNTISLGTITVPTHLVLQPGEYLTGTSVAVQGSGQSF